MAGCSMWRRRGIAAAIVVSTTVMLGACGTSDTPPPGGDSRLGDAPLASASPSAPSPSARPSRTTAATGAPVYPKDPKAYSQELFKAWAGPNYARLSQLAIQSAVQQIRDSITFGGKPNSTWTHISCGPDADTGFTLCIFRNAHGDEATIKLNNTQLGFPTSVTEAMLNRTEYSDDPGSYAAAFMSAWQEGNRQRMARYSSSSIAAFFLSQSGPLAASSQDTPVDIGGGFVKIHFSGLSGDSGRDYTVKVLAKPGGKANAIKGYCTGVDCTP